VATSALGAFAISKSTAADDASSDGANRGKFFKSVKWGMVGTGGTVMEKFKIQKALGYDGIELTSPGGPKVDVVLAASKATGMPVHGVVDSVHWGKRLSSPDEKTRNAGREALVTAIKDTHAYGGSSVLLVPGRVAGKDETHDHVWDRSIAEIRKVLPLASRLGIHVLIENVWNGFCEQPEQLRDYIDAINSPWVGVYFDIGNHQKFAPSEKWVQVLGQRIVKLDVKDWGVKPGFCKLGDGDVNWPAVRKALANIGFHGWCTAEVRGGNRERLAEIAERMNKCLAL
jgi:hexulose-6-phosphate isomerase